MLRNFCEQLQKHLYKSICFLGFLLCANLGFAQNLPVFPGAVGFGTDTPAGRGGKIFKVTNLNESGSGSLSACTEASGPRICIFEVSGVIELTDDIKINNPFITIAGQTAPPPGILIRGGGIKINNTNNVLIQHLRVRVGDLREGPDPSNRDSIVIQGGSDVHHIVIDHVSASWAIDENISIWGRGIKDITISNSIISEGLNDSLHPKGSHSKGIIVGASDGGPEPQNISIIGNLMAHNFERNPLMSGGAVIVNNLIYNWQYLATDLRGAKSDAIEPTFASIVGNVYKRGRSTDDKLPVRLQRMTSDSEIYLYDNWAEELSGDDQSTIVDNRVSSDIEVSTRRLWPARLVALPTTEVEQSVLSNAGARPGDRDEVDLRIVDSVDSITGTMIDCISTCDGDDRRAPGGWPTLANNYRELTVPQNPNEDDDGNGYTNVEDWIHEFSMNFANVPPEPIVTPEPPVLLLAE
jgi:pectate lyase